MPIGPAFIGKTSAKWFSFLRNLSAVDEVNFWRPSGRGFEAIPPHSPYLFELVGRPRTICGFGFFTRYERLPLWLAWDTFGTANGAPDLHALVSLIGQNREGTSEQSEIGCIMIRDATFFRDDEFVMLPSSWPANIQVGKKFDLASNADGKRIWDACMDRAVARRAVPIVGTPDQKRRYAEEKMYRARLGQGSFRIEVSKAYDWSCAVTEEHSRPVLEAAHIKPYSEEGEHDVRNGLLLRSDIHRLFDRGYVTVTPDHKFCVSDALKRDYSNGRAYYPLNGKTIHLPADSSDFPSAELLTWHNRNRFDLRLRG